MYNKSQATYESWVYCAFHICSQNSKSAVCFHSLQEVVDFYVCISVVAILYFTSLAKEGIGFIKKQDRPAVFGGLKQSSKVFFCFAYIFAYNCRKVNTV